MKTTAFIALLATLATPTAFADTNVALGADVTAAGSGFGSSAGWGAAALAPLSTLTDGLFLPTGQQWNSGTVFWQGDANTLTITLNQASTVNNLHLEGDNNDAYAISFRDLAGSWHGLATIHPNTNSGWGLGDGFASFAPVTATAFQIAATGDNSYSVAEFQVFGTAVAVPEPESMALMLAGLAVVGVAARRRQAK